MPVLPCFVSKDHSVAAVNQAGLGERVIRISTGGGASLELLEGQTLFPGVAALSQA